MLQTAKIGLLILYNMGKEAIDVMVSQTLSKHTTIEDLGKNVSILDSYKQQEYSALELVGILKKAAEICLSYAETENSVKFWATVMHSCQEWVEDEIEVIAEHYEPYR